VSFRSSEASCKLLYAFTFTLSLLYCSQLAVWCLLPAAVAMVLGNAVSSDFDDDLDTTLPNVVLDQDDLELLDVGFSDDESDGNQADANTLL